MTNDPALTHQQQNLFCLLGEKAGEVGLLVADGPEQLILVAPVEGRLPDKHLVQEDTEAPPVHTVRVLHPLDDLDREGMRVTQQESLLTRRPRCSISLPHHLNLSPVLLPRKNRKNCKLTSYACLKYKFCFLLQNSESPLKYLRESKSKDYRSVTVLPLQSSDLSTHLWRHVVRGAAERVGRLVQVHL